MPTVDRGQYEILRDEEVPYNAVDVENPSAMALQLDGTHNLDLFFSQIYQYHRLGGFTVIVTSDVLSLFKFVFLFFCLMELSVCVKWDQLMDPTASVRTWDDVALPPAVCWATLPPFATLCLVLAIAVFSAHLIRRCIEVSQLWGVRRFCSLILDLPTCDSDLADIMWSEVLRRLICVQSQMPISRVKPQLDELDIYNRILRQENYLIGMVSRRIIPLRFRLPGLDGQHFVYLPNYYLFNLKLLLFWGPKSPFASYCQLRQECKFISKREQLAQELAKQSRIIGLFGLLLSPVAFLTQLLVFLFSNAQRLRYEPSQLFGRSWSNYARLYLRHFNELPHEFDMRLGQAYTPASQYLECFPSRLLNTIATNVAFTLGGVSILLFAASLFRESLIHLTGYLAAMAIGGLVARVAFGFLPSENNVHFPKAKLIATLARIHYMPDHWKENAHTHTVRWEFSQLFQYRLVGALEEIVSPILTPLIMLFCVPNRSLDIVDFLRNYTVELEGVGDVCSFAQLDIPRHGDPEWSPCDDSAPVSPNSEEGDAGEDAEEGSDERRELQNHPAGGGKTELSLMHFYHTNPNWNLPENCKAYLEAVRRQAFTDMQRQQVDMLRGIPIYSSLYGKGVPGDAAAATTSTASPQARTDPFYLPDTSGHQIKNVSHLPTMGNENLALGVRGALAESMTLMKPTSGTPTTGNETPAELSPKVTGAARAVGVSGGGTTAPLYLLNMAQSLMYQGPGGQLSAATYQPYTSQTEDRPGFSTDSFCPTPGSIGGSMSFGELANADMDMSTLYLHELHQRRRIQQRASQPSLCVPSAFASTRDFRQRSSANDLILADEIRYQQPTGSSAFRFSNSGGRGVRLLTSAAGLRPGRRQCEEVVEEDEGDSPQQVMAAGSGTPGEVARPQDGEGGGEEDDTVQKWPNLPPAHC